MKHLTYILILITLCTESCHYHSDELIQTDNPIIILSYSLPDCLDSTLIVNDGDIWRELNRLSMATDNDSLEIHLLNTDGQYNILATTSAIQITTTSRESAQTWNQKLYDWNYPFYIEQNNDSITFYIFADSGNTQKSQTQN